MTDAVTPLSAFEETRLRLWLAEPRVTRFGREDVARLLATLDEVRRDNLEPEGAHPGEPHDFRARCIRCGEPGTVNLSVLAPGEVLRIEPVHSPQVDSANDEIQRASHAFEADR